MRMLTAELRSKIVTAITDESDGGFAWGYDEIEDAMVLLNSVPDGTWIDIVEGVTDVQVFYDEPDNDDLRDQIVALINSHQARVLWTGEVLTLWGIVKLVDEYYDHAIAGLS